MSTVWSPELDTHLEAGQSALAHGDLEAARHFFMAVLSLQVDHEPARQGLITTLIQQGLRAEAQPNLIQARRCYQQVLVLSPEHGEARFRLTVLKHQHKARWQPPLRWFGGLAAIVLLLVGGYVFWPRPDCPTGQTNCVVAGIAFPTPTLSPTLPLSPSPTATATTFPTATATVTPSPTATATPVVTPGPTPEPIIAQARYNHIPYYRAPDIAELGQHLGLIDEDTPVYVCAMVGRFYQIALNNCHLSPPLGWAHSDRLILPKQARPPLLNQAQPVGTKPAKPGTQVSED